MVLNKLIIIGKPADKNVICDKIINITPELIIFPYNLTDNETIFDRSLIKFNGNNSGIG